MAAGITKALWEMSDLAEMIDTDALKPGPRRPYKKKIIELIPTESVTPDIIKIFRVIAVHAFWKSNYGDVDYA